MNTLIKNKRCSVLVKPLLLGACLILSLSSGLRLANANDSGVTTPKPTEVRTLKQTLALHTEDLRQLMVLLYDMHPQALKKSTQVSAREMAEWVFDGKAGWKFDAIRNQQSVAALQLVFDSSYQGDRVLALIVGLETMLFQAYGVKSEFEMLMPTDIKKLNIAEYNIQLLIQKLNQSCTQANGTGLCVPSAEYSALFARIINRLAAHRGLHPGTSKGSEANVVQHDGFILLDADRD